MSDLALVLGLRWDLFGVVRFFFWLGVEFLENLFATHFRRI
jgi:hypothetical protein